MALVPDAVYEYTKTRKENGFPYSNQKFFSALSSVRFSINPPKK
jgi:hypothetical protein